MAGGFDLARGLPGLLFRLSHVASEVGDHGVIDHDEPTREPEETSDDHDPDGSSPSSESALVPRSLEAATRLKHAVYVPSCLPYYKCASV